MLHWNFANAVSNSFSFLLLQSLYGPRSCVLIQVDISCVYSDMKLEAPQKITVECKN